MVECLLNPIPHEKGDCCEGKAGRADSGQNAVSCDDSLTQHLEAEPQSVKEHYETPDQGELRASNEELRAINKELRSAGKELETGKEELQWVNEELVTVNRDLKSDVAGLGRANSDLQNLMAATDIGRFLDRQLSVKGSLPECRMFNLILADVGRPLSDITHKLKYDSWPRMRRSAEEPRQH